MQIESLSNLCNEVSYGYTASAIEKNTGIKFLRITDIQNGVVNWDSVPFCNIEKRLIEKYLLDKNDIVVARTGNSTGENYLYKGNFSTVFASYLIRFRIDLNKAFPAYVWWNMRTTNWWNFINNVKTGSAQAGANAKVLGEYPIKLPSYLQQKAIAHILDSLDDKIELNQKINQTLEEIAKAIFKSWFIDFDPVRAKVEGRPTGLPDEISDLFPNQFVESELGEIPKGFFAGTLSDYLSIQGGYAFKSKDFVDVGIKVVKIKNIQEDGTVDISFCDCVNLNDPKLDKFSLATGDIVVAMTGATIGKIGVIYSLGKKIYLNQRVGRVKPKFEPIGKCWYSYLSINSETVRSAIENSAYGSAQPNISSSDIESIPYVFPGESIINNFNRTVSAFFEKIIINQSEIFLLEELRNMLLPKLISGELQIPDAEKFLEEAGI